MIIAIYEYTCLLVFIFVFIGGLKDHIEPVINFCIMIHNYKGITHQRTRNQMHHSELWPPYTRGMIFGLVKLSQEIYTRRNIYTPMNFWPTEFIFIIADHFSSSSNWNLLKLDILKSTFD